MLTMRQTAVGGGTSTIAESASDGRLAGRITTVTDTGQGIGEAEGAVGPFFVLLASGDFHCITGPSIRTDGGTLQH
jgi:hypothetical protein